ncbi:thaumatin-like protein 1 [Primulina eburnea]|uniref:thaumatin-like protein 1 n=1 Tax=Primulina eburnea TaxID=1245227 RepID=UPI003C6C8EB8
MVSSSCSSNGPYILILTFLVVAKGVVGAIFTMINRCDHTVWPGILSNAGNAALETTGFQLPPGGSRLFQVQPGWSGRLWGRTGCTFDPTTGLGSCTTGDCGSNQIECNGAGANPPATLAEFSIGSGQQDFYDVSLVDGYNLPMIIEPVGGSGVCGLTGCITNINWKCPAELRAADGQACKSACDAFKSPEYCCSGAFGSPATCQPSVYSEIFKSTCPRAYSYAYDDATSTFTCGGADYTITFCPSLTSQKSSRDSTTPMTAGSGLPIPPPPAAATMDGSRSDQPQVLNLPAWLPNFVLGGASDHSMQSYLISCVSMILFTLSFLDI